jgi:2-oxoglutarate ferredoxin oxidoreductase subunit alpha
MADKEGIKLGLVRPVTLWPFPKEAFEKVIDKTKHGFLAVEMSMGQMVEDVALAVKDRNNVEHYGRSGGMVPSPKEILDKAKEMIAGGVK